MNILVALDLSSATPPILAAVDSLVRTAGDRVRLLHVEEPDPAFVGWGVGPDSVREDVAEVIFRDHREIHALAEGLERRGIRTDARQVQAPTVEGILDQARDFEADLVVVGSHGHGAVYHLLAGSTVQELLRHGTVPLLVVPVRHPSGG